MHIKELCEESHRRSVASGWWHESSSGEFQLECEYLRYVIATKFSLIHSEISEAFEGYRKDQPDDHLPHRPSIEVELADALIRIGDLAGALGLDLEGAVREKMEYNMIRADHKKEARQAKGGKKF